MMRASYYARQLRRRGALTLQALAALAIFSLGLLAITSISIRQLTATRYAAKGLARIQLAESTMAALESDTPNLQSGTRLLDDVVADGLTFRREVTVTPEENDKILHVSCQMWIVEENRPRGQVWTYQKKLLRI